MHLDPVTCRPLQINQSHSSDVIHQRVYLHKTLHGTDYIPSCIAVLLSISFIRWSEPSMVKPRSSVFDVLQHAIKSDISIGLHQSKRMEKTIRTDTITVLLPIKEHKRIRYIMAYREPLNICPGLIFVCKDFLMGAYVQGPYILLLYM